MIQRRRLATRKRNMLLEGFVFCQTATVAANRARVNRNTANFYFKHFREIIFEHTRKVPRFCGEVEIDQAFFGKGKNQVKVLGMLRRGVKDVYLHIIENATRKTLFPIIHLVVEPGTTIYTDEWAAYDTLKDEGYIHKTVNHSQGFCDPEERSINTGSIDQFWGSAKQRLRQFKGLPREAYSIHLKECEFRHNHKKDMLEVMKVLMKKSPTPTP